MPHSKMLLNIIVLLYSLPLIYTFENKRSDEDQLYSTDGNTTKVLVISLSTSLSLIAIILCIITTIVCAYCCIFEYKMCTPIDDPTQHPIHYTSVNNNDSREDIHETVEEPITLQERFYSNSVLIKEGPPSYLEALTSPMFLNPPENSIFFQNSSPFSPGDTTDTLLQNYHTDSVSLQMSEYDDTELPPYEVVIGYNSPLPSSRVTIAINGVPLDNDINDSVGYTPNETLFVISNDDAINNDDGQIESESNNMSIDPELAIVTATPVTDVECNNELTSRNDNVTFNEGHTLNSTIASDNLLNYEVSDVNSTNNIGNTSTTTDIALNEESITVDTSTITTAQPITTITRAARRSMLVSTSCEDILQTSSETSFPSSSIVEMTLTEVDSVISCDNVPSTAVVSHYMCVVSS